MSLGGPQLQIERDDDDDMLVRALRLARELESLLEDSADRRMTAAGNAPDSPRGASTRMARALAASLVGELDSIARGGKRSGVS